MLLALNIDKISKDMCNNIIRNQVRLSIMIFSHVIVVDTLNIEHLKSTRKGP